LLKRLKIPPAPVLSPEEEQATFKVAPGYRVELVAAEPLVHNPIFFEFDPDGRIWVVEYQGYMRDVAGTGEGDPICRVVVLEDTDADGRADKSTVFLDQLVMPRSFAFVKGGVLLQEPPTLWFCEDTDGDLRANRKTAVGTMGVAGNPQPNANGELQLPARLATTYAQKLAYRPSLDVLAPWRVKDDAAGWSVEVPVGGIYEGVVTLAADEASADDRFRIESEGSHTIGTVLSSGGYDRFREVPAGRLTLRPGVNRILMRAEGPLRQELADVRALRLVPVK
jgi:hypothetical protein